MSDRITELRIDGLRTIENLKLSLDGLTVLIGENGSGKSSIIEACQILRAAARPEFSRAFHGIHGGMFSLLRDGATDLRLGVTVEGDSSEPLLEYDVTLSHQGAWAAIAGERLVERASGEASPTEPGVIDRSQEVAHVRRRSLLPALDENVGAPVRWSQATLPKFDANELLLASAQMADDPAAQRVRRALGSIDVHLPFDVLPGWAARGTRRPATLRGTLAIQNTDRLELFADNLPNAYHALLNGRSLEHWQQTLAYVRLGLGDHVENVTTYVDPGGGAIGLGLRLRGSERTRPVSSLSDGELAYLAFVALYRLEAPCALLAFDEPDLHLHPGVLVRVMQFFQAMAEEHPVLLATHSDTVLDCIDDPVRSVRVCEIEEPQRRTVVHSLDAEALASWLRDYRGVGHIRGEGYLSLLLRRD